MSAPCLAKAKELMQQKKDGTIPKKTKTQHASSSNSLTSADGEVSTDLMWLVLFRSSDAEILMSGNSLVGRASGATEGCGGPLACHNTRNRRRDETVETIANSPTWQQELFPTCDDVRESAGRTEKRCSNSRSGRGTLGAPISGNQGKDHIIQAEI